MGWSLRSGLLITDFYAFCACSSHHARTLLDRQVYTICKSAASHGRFTQCRDPAAVCGAFVAAVRDGGMDASLDPGKQTIVLCHHGVRSMHASQYLIQQGFSSVYNVTGGIDAYSRQVDPRVPLY